MQKPSPNHHLSLAESQDWQITASYLDRQESSRNADGSRGTLSQRAHLVFAGLSAQRLSYKDESGRQDGLNVVLL